MLNTLANHGYLPRNGQNITAEMVYSAFNASLNFNNSILIQATEAALTMSTTGDSTTFNLADTVEHDIIEHDASLSRKDLYFGDNLDFDADVWANTTAFFTADPITLEMAAQARAARIGQAQAINPDFYFPDDLAQNQLSETALYLIILGDENGNAPASYVEALFGTSFLYYLWAETNKTMCCAIGLTIVTLIS
jgi:hypothetical protein